MIEQLNMKTKLKTCPHCGGKATVEHEELEFPEGEDWLRVVCEDCGSNSGWYRSEDQAVNAWNRRSALNDSLSVPSKEMYKLLKKVNNILSRFALEGVIDVIELYLLAEESRKLMLRVEGFGEV